MSTSVMFLSKSVFIFVLSAVVVETSNVLHFVLLN